MPKLMFYWWLLCTAMKVFNFFTLLHNGTGTQKVNIIASLDLNIQFISGQNIGSLLDLGSLLQGILTALLP